jgi:hypothetical protein
VKRKDKTLPRMFTVWTLGFIFTMIAFGKTFEWDDFYKLDLFYKAYTVIAVYWIWPFILWANLVR